MTVITEENMLAVTPYVGRFPNLPRVRFSISCGIRLALTSVLGPFGNSFYPPRPVH